MILFSASPHIAGATDFLTRLLAEKLSFSQIIFLRDYHILPCEGCGICATEKKCIKDDDFFHLINFISGEKFLLLFPVYFGSIPAFLKAFIDRFQFFYRTGNKLLNTESLILAIKGSSKIKENCVFLPIEYAFNVAKIHIINKFLLDGIESYESLIDTFNSEKFTRLIEEITKWDFMK